MAREYLGTGIKYPLQLDRKGELMLSSEDENIQESILIILGTAIGERLMRPVFGCRIHELVFAPNNAGTAGLARFYVEDALIRWEPRIKLERIEVEPDEKDPALLLISVNYQVRATDSQANLVYPFYLTRGGVV